MSPESAKKFILIFSSIWAVIALALFGLALAKVMPLATFEWVFATGFVIWSVIATIVFRFTQNQG